MRLVHGGTDSVSIDSCALGSAIWSSQLVSQHLSLVLFSKHAPWIIINDELVIVVNSSNL